jgi:TonB family protein
VAWELLYVSESTAGDWEKSATDALAAAQYLSRHSGLVARQRSAELHAASVQFIRGRGQIAQGRNNYYETIADVHDRIVADLEAASSQSDRAALWPLKWRAEAWTLAIESYLTSNYEQIESHISTKLRPRELARPTMGEIAEDPALAQIPFCDGEFEGKKMTYPSSKAYVGLVGSVIARLETDAKGKVVKVAVAAAVPGDGFGESVAKTLSTWSFKPAKGVDTSTCRMETRNRYYKVIFFIE